jgi:hypothetical protein
MKKLSNCSKDISNEEEAIAGKPITVNARHGMHFDLLQFLSVLISEGSDN